MQKDPCGFCLALIFALNCSNFAHTTNNIIIKKINYRVSRKTGHFQNIKNIPDLFSDDKEGKIM